MRMDQQIKRRIEQYTFEASRLPPSEALKKYEVAYNQAKELDNPFTIRACAANLGAAYVSLVRQDEAEKGLEYLHKALPPEGKADGASNGDLYFNMGFACKVLGKNRDASNHFEKAWQEYKKERDNLTMEMDTLKQLVEVSRKRQKFTEAISWYRTLEDTYGRANKQLERLLAMVQRITLQNRHGLEGVKEALNECCAMVDSIKNSGQSTVGILVQVAVLLTQCKDLERAKKNLEEARDSFEADDGLSMEKAVVLQNLGTIYNYKCLWKESIQYHQEAANIYKYFTRLQSDPWCLDQPRTAKRCWGHCLANHGYALVQMGDVDEGRVKFFDALRLADESDDIDTKWQMKEALGAMHFRLALHDINLPSPMSATMKVALPESRINHLSKSVEWYKAALTDLALSPRGTEQIKDRILQKYTLVQTFKNNATAIAYRLILPAHATASISTRPQTDTAKTGESVVEDGETDSTGDDESGGDDELEEEGSEEGEEVEEEVGDKGEDKEEEAVDERDGIIKKTRAAPPKPSLQGRVHLQLGAGQMHTSAEEEDDDTTQVKEAYRQQLGFGMQTLRDQNKKTVQADVHQHVVSSSAESGSEITDASEDDDDDDDDDVNQGQNAARGRGPLPPVPTQSPPRTMQASGTYEHPRDPVELHVNPVYQGTDPSPPVPPPELVFVKKRQKQGESGGEEEDRRMSLNFFISSSEEEGETERTTKQRESDKVKEEDTADAAGAQADEDTGDIGVDVGDDETNTKEKKKCSKACLVM